MRGVWQLLLGFGVVKWAFGGITLFSRARTAFITLVTPEAPSEWPTLGLTLLSQLVCDPPKSIRASDQYEPTAPI